MKRYLVIDDNPEVLSMFFEIGSEEGRKVFLASSLYEASLLLEAIKFDVIVCDHVLKDNEIGALYATKAKILQPQAKFILMSGLKPELTVEQKAKIDSFIAKPEAIKDVWEDDEVKGSA